ncbi:MAG: hypothetical protein H7Y88_03450 [Phycisphaerales bacterium]|nr:hypothetical protein [Phycisphaerales bacterium]
MSIRSTTAVLIAVCGLAAAANAQVVDGTAEGLYGAPLAVQNVQTQFGDANIGQLGFANGSELDAAYGFISAGNLHLVLAGNLESNFNKIEIFFDSVAGGQNQLRGDNPDVDFNGLNRMGNDGSGNGLRFDTGFEADRYLTITNGDIGGGTYQMFANFAEVLSAGGGAGMFLGGASHTPAQVIGPNGIIISMNNSNVAGVDGGTGPASGLGVFTGVELVIPLSALGDPSGEIRISAFINGGGHDFLANQVLGGLGAGTGNLGEPRNVDFSAIAGDQFFTVIPAPGAVGLLGLAGLAAARRRRN